MAKILIDFIRHHLRSREVDRQYSVSGTRSLVIIVPFLGVFIYVIVRGKSMGERDMAEAQAQNDAFKSYVQQTASTGGTADQLAKLADLMNTGAITQAEYDTAKAKVLA